MLNKSAEYDAGFYDGRHAERARWLERTEDAPSEAYQLVEELAAAEAALDRAIMISQSLLAWAWQGKEGEAE